MPRTGRPRKAPLQGDVEVSAAETLAALLLNAPPERQQALVDAIYDKAIGFRWWAGPERRPGRPGPGVRERKVRVEDLETGEELKGFIYEVPGDAGAQRLLVEQGVGRAPAREATRIDPVIQIIHRVPGRRALRPGASSVAEEKAVVPVEAEEEPAALLDVAGFDDAEFLGPVDVERETEEGEE